MAALLGQSLQSRAHHFLFDALCDFFSSLLMSMEQADDAGVIRVQYVSIFVSDN